MQRLEVSGAVRPLYVSLGVKGLKSSSSWLRLPPRLPVPFLSFSQHLLEASTYTECDQLG